jgi:hypothetical protein
MRKRPCRVASCIWGSVLSCGFTQILKAIPTYLVVPQTHEDSLEQRKDLEIPSPVLGRIY